MTAAHGTAPHGIDWPQVRRVLATGLGVGDRFVTPGPGTAYHAAPDGTVRGVAFGMGSMPLDGLLWTITACEGGEVTACSHTGRVLTDTPRDGAHVLKVAAEAPGA